jgi:hypothetical protein
MQFFVEAHSSGPFVIGPGVEQVDGDEPEPLIMVPLNEHDPPTLIVVPHGGRPHVVIPPSSTRPSAP